MMPCEECAMQLRLAGVSRVIYLFCDQKYSTSIKTFQDADITCHPLPKREVFFKRYGDIQGEKMFGIDPDEWTPEKMKHQVPRPIRPALVMTKDPVWRWIKDNKNVPVFISSTDKKFNKVFYDWFVVQKYCAGFTMKPLPLTRQSMDLSGRLNLGENLAQTKQLLETLTTRIEAVEKHLRINTVAET